MRINKKLSSAIALFTILFCTFGSTGCAIRSDKKNVAVSTAKQDVYNPENYMPDNYAEVNSSTREQRMDSILHDFMGKSLKDLKQPDIIPDKNKNYYLYRDGDYTYKFDEVGNMIWLTNDKLTNAGDKIDRTKEEVAKFAKEIMKKLHREDYVLTWVNINKNCMNSEYDIAFSQINKKKFYTGNSILISLNDELKVKSIVNRVVDSKLFSMKPIISMKQAEAIVLKDVKTHPQLAKYDGKFVNNQDRYNLSNFQYYISREVIDDKQVWSICFKIPDCDLDFYYWVDTRDGKILNRSELL